ncbi:MAG: hypothetical protein LBP87_07375, partial [Planctomycetaceae bacterium]|nr:hypothetical protein [Planctomycetaceae bacterium]
YFLSPAGTRLCITVGVAKRNLRTNKTAPNKSPAWGEIISPNNYNLALAGIRKIGLGIADP